MYRVLYFTAGAVIGSVATYFLVKEKFEKQAQEDINEMRKEYKKDITDAITDAVENLNEISEKKQESDIFHKPDPYKEDYRKYSGASTSDEDTGEVPENDTPVSEAETVSPKEEVAQFPYRITGDDFVNTMRFFDKITIAYYDDKVLMNEDNQPVDVGLIGEPNLKDFDEDWRYIRNERVSTDFEIERVRCCYGDGDDADMLPADGS